MNRRWSGGQLARLPLYILLGIGGITLALFVAAGLTMKGGFAQAWEVLLGIHTPFASASGLGVPLSAIGYIALPIVIGLAAVDGVGRFTHRRLMTTPEAEASIRELIDKEVRQLPVSPRRDPGDGGSRG